MSEELRKKEERVDSSADETAGAVAVIPTAGKRVDGSVTLRNFVIGGAVGLAVLVIGAAAVFGVGVYKLGWKGRVAAAVLQAVPYPAAIVNKNSIRFADYLGDIEALNKFFAGQKADVGPDAPDGQFPTDAEIRQNVIDRLIRNEVLKEEALRYNVAVTSKEIDDEFDKLATQSGGAEAAMKLLADLYGWSAAAFKDKVIYPFLLEQKLGEALRQDRKLADAARTEAADLLVKLKEGLPFEDAARQFSDDAATAERGGDLDWFERGIMVKEFEDAAFALSPGQLSEVVETPFGSHLIRVDDVEKENGQVTRVKARHILVSTVSLEKYLNDAIASARIKNFVGAN